jgi:hypothetical protein
MGRFPEVRCCESSPCSWPVIAQVSLVSLVHVAPSASAALGKKKSFHLHWDCEVQSDCLWPSSMCKHGDCFRLRHPRPVDTIRFASFNRDPTGTGNVQKLSHNIAYFICASLAKRTAAKRTALMNPQSLKLILSTDRVTTCYNKLTRMDPKLGYSRRFLWVCV